MKRSIIANMTRNAFTLLLIFVCMSAINLNIDAALTTVEHENHSEKKPSPRPSSSPSKEPTPSPSHNPSAPPTPGPTSAYNSSEIIDKDTPASARSIVRFADGKLLRLVMSDEFETEGRSFGPGDDPVFQAIDGPDDENSALEFYNSSIDYVTTRNGSLVITTKPVNVSWSSWNWSTYSMTPGEMEYSSGMLQSWNKFCFTGGVLEISVQLPGSQTSGTVWPAFWLMGNLGRALDNSEFIWPWSYSECNMDVPNLLETQLINACDGNPGYGFNPYQGRGSPEIDIFEVMSGMDYPADYFFKGSPSLDTVLSTSLQVSPASWEGTRPTPGVPLNASADDWYKGLKIEPLGMINYGFYGQWCVGEDQISYQEDAISVNSPLLGDTYFTDQHIFRLEWQPGEDGYLSWYLDDKFILEIPASSIRNQTGAIIPEEPMYFVTNVAVSTTWGWPKSTNCSTVCTNCYDPACQCSLPEGAKNCSMFPSEMKIGYIRLYQDPTDPTHTLGCSPEGYPTEQFIQENPSRFVDWAPVPMPPWTEIVLYWMSTNPIAVTLILAAMIIFAYRYQALLHCLCVREKRLANSRMLSDRYAYDKL